MPGGGVARQRALRPWRRFHIKEGIEQIDEDRAGHVKQAQGVLIPQVEVTNSSNIVWGQPQVLMCLKFGFSLKPICSHRRSSNFCGGGAKPLANTLSKVAASDDVLFAVSRIFPGVRGWDDELVKRESHVWCRLGEPASNDQRLDPSKYTPRIPEPYKLKNDYPA